VKARKIPIFAFPNSINVKEYEKNISTVGKKEKKQTRFQIANGYKKWSPCVGCSPPQGKKKVDSFG